MRLHDNKQLFLFGWLLPVLFIICQGPSPVAAAETSKFMALGTATLSGVFHPVGEGICRLINEDRLEHGYRCLAYVTGAAVNNLQAIDTGDLELGISYANLFQEAREGVGPFADDEPMRDLRLITTLYDMPAVIIINKELPVDTIAGLAGLRINVGNVGSGKRTIADSLIKAMNWTRRDFASFSDLDTTEVEEPFCRGEIDAIVEAMAFDAPFFERITRDCGGRILAIPEVVIKNVRESSPGLGEIIISGGKYPHNPDEIHTLGINTVLVTSQRVNSEAIYSVTKSIFNKFSDFCAVHPALSSNTKALMAKRTNSLPFHEGALRYYEEHGLSCQ